MTAAIRCPSGAPIAPTSWASHHAKEAIVNDPLTPQELAQFTGTEQRYRHAVNRKVLFTDGAKYVADRAEAHWLLDAIALIQPNDERVAAEPFQVWTLRLNADRTGQLLCEDGNENVVYSKAIPLTDFPGEGITLWFSDNTILLPGEY
jgi:hypothetical protein